MRYALLLLALFATPVTAQFKMPELPINLEEATEVAKELKGTVGETEFEEERAIGQSVAATLLGGAKPVTDKTLQSYVNRVGLWVAMQSGRADIPWRFAVLENPNVNAFAAPGGYVFITRGLLNQLGSEAELAGVLGHEIAHVVKKHHLKALKKESGMKLIGRVAPLALEKKANSGKVDMEQLGKVAQVTKGLYTRGLDKDDEFQADQIGVRLAARAGYDPYGLAQVLQTLDSLKADSGQLALLFKTHPRPSDRLQALEAGVGRRLAKLPPLPSLPQRFGQYVR